MDFKKMTTMSVSGLICALAVAQNSFAEDVTIIGEKEQVIKQATIDSSSNSNKTIQLLHVELSDEAKTTLANQAKDALKHTHQFALSASESHEKQLGMNKVPVLDQGSHGTCVTFAVTGALDALIGKGDYISQLCNLQLGTYLENHGYGISGWNGSYATTVINQMTQYGAINMHDQRTYGCGGLKKYPTYSAHDPRSFMEPEQFLRMSELIFGKVADWTDVLHRKEPVRTLEEVKQSLDAGNRLVFAVLLPRTDLGTAGAVGKHNTWFYKDTWVLTPEVLAGVETVDSAHEMIITGYDDNAEAKDDHGKKHKGLLTVRNSWGDSVGYYGEFYMSYDYFKLLTFDVQRFSPVTH